eukprot:4846319-Pyramimonas_sp.AAC.1
MSRSVGARVIDETHGRAAAGSGSLRPGPTPASPGTRTLHGDPAGPPPSPLPAPPPARSLCRP